MKISATIGACKPLPAIRKNPEKIFIPIFFHISQLESIKLGKLSQGLNASCVGKRPDQNDHLAFPTQRHIGR